MNRFLFFFSSILFLACNNKEKSPVASFSVISDSCDSLCEVQFVNESENATSYIWDFGDGTTSTEESPIHTYDSLQVYTVSLESISVNGSDKVVKDLYFGDEPTVVDADMPFWEYGAGRSYPQSFRNHHYTFKVDNNNTNVEINLESDAVNVYIWVYNSLGEQLERGGGGLSRMLNLVLNSGTYTVIAGTNDRGAIGNYNLDVKGNGVSEINRISSNRLTIDDGVWDEGGGGHSNYSFRNHYYKFEVEENNTYVDIVLQSPDTEVALYLYDSFETYERQYGNKTEEIVYQLNAGSYFLLVSPRERNQPISNYYLDIAGQVSNLEKISSTSKLFENVSWEDDGGGGLSYPFSFRNHRYLVEVTKNNTSIDAILRSNEAEVCIWFYDTNGEFIKREYGTKNEFLIGDVNEGTYLLIVGPRYRDVPDADYTLDIVGALGEVTKMQSQSEIKNGSWGSGGGSNNPDASGNDVYTFDVTINNSMIDISLESSDTDVCLWLYSPLNELMDREYGDRKEFIVSGVNEGTYKIIIGTSAQGASGNYKLAVVGEFVNLVEE